MKTINFKTLSLTLFAASMLSLTGCDKSGTPSDAEGIIGIDRTAPVITLVGGDITMNEDSPYVEPGATVVDDIDGTIPVVITGTVDDATPGVYTLTYTATDSSANVSSVTRTVTVLDITPPVITLNGDDNVTIDQGDTYTEENATSVDNVDGIVPVVITGTVDTDTVGVYTLTYTATDSSANTSNVTRTVNVVYSGPAPLDGNITIDNAALQSIIVSIFDNTPYNPAISVQGVINTQGLTVSVPYTVNNAPVTLAAYSTSVTLDASVTEDDEAGIVATFAWAEQNLPVGSGTFTATIDINDSAGNQDNVYKAEKLDIDNIAGLVAATFPYATDSLGSEGNLTLKIMPGIPDRMFGVADNNGDTTSHMFLYMPVTNPTTGKTWLNNNLGANYANVNSPVFNLEKQATGLDDYNAYGSHFQWGRKADGHELITWTSSTTGIPTGIAPGNGGDPDHALFVADGFTPAPYDWRDPQDETLWALESSANNVCPVGYRVPTIEEWQQEVGSWQAQTNIGASNSALALTSAGYRYFQLTAQLEMMTNFGMYWSSTTTGTNANRLLVYWGAPFFTATYRVYGMPVRCIKD